MSWIKSPTLIQSPIHPEFTFGDSSLNFDFYIGQGSDDGYYCFYAYLGGNNPSTGYVIAKKILPDVKVGSVTLTAQTNALVNGYVYFVNGNYKLYYTSKYGWVYSNDVRVAIGSDPIEESTKDSNGNVTYSGDAFYTASYSYSDTFPSNGTDVTFVGRGSLRNNQPTVTLTFSFPRFDKDSSSELFSTPFGTYSAVDGESGTKTVGLPKFNLSNGKVAIRSLEKTSNRFTYGDIRYVSSRGKWVLGTVNDASGWWEGDEPSVSTVRTFTFTKPEGSTATGSNITVTFDSYIEGDNVKPFYIGDVAIWR